MKICKKILSVVLALALTLSLFGALTVSADTTAAVTFDIYEEVVDEAAGVNMLVFKANLPAGRYGSCGLLFSFDNTKVELVDFETYEPVTADDDGTYYALETINRWAYASTKTKATEGRTYIKADAFYAKGTTLSSAGELEFTKVYFKYKDGAKPSKDTFKLESDYTDGSWLKECYPNSSDSTAAAISVLDAGSAITYTYNHAAGTDANPIAVNSFEHSGTGAVSTVRVVPNTAVNMPEEVYRPIVYAIGGHDGYFSIVLPKGAEAIMGIDMAALSAPIVTKDTLYDGLYMDGHLYLSNASWKYTPEGKGTGTDGELKPAEKESNRALLNGPTTLDFKNVRIERVRKSSAGNLIIEAKPASIAAGAISIKKYAGTVDLASLTEQTVIEKEEVDFTGTVRDDFLYYSDPYWVNNMSIYTGEGYKEEAEVNVAPFTEDTLFLSMDAAHVYAGAIPANKWLNTTQLGWNFWYRSSTAGQGDDTGPYQVVVPKVSGEYKVYGLKYGHATTTKKAKVDVNGNQYTFGSVSGSGWNIFWDVPTKNKGEDTVTLTAGVPIFVGDITYKGDTYGQGGLLAIAFVPIDKVADITLSADNNAGAEIISNSNIGAFTSVDFGANLAKTYTIKLKYSTEGEGAEVDYGAKPYFRRNQSTGSATWPYEGNSMVGHPTGYATAADLMTQFLMETKGMTEEEAWDLALKDTYQMYVNGIREYRVNQKLILPGDVVEIKKEAVTSANFNPLPLGSYINGSWYGSDANVRFGLKAGTGYINKDTYPHLYSGIYYGYGNANNIKGTYPTDTYFAGFMIRQTGDYAGQKVYFPMAKLTSKNNDVSGDASQFLPNVEGYAGSDTNKAIDNTINVTTPEGEKTVLNPYVITNGNGVSAAYYNAGGLYWVNSTTTSDVRYEVIDGEYVLRTDGFVLVRVVTKKADGSVKTVRTELTPGKSYVFKPVAGETVYVWEDTAYNGTTMVPLLAPFTVE